METTAKAADWIGHHARVRPTAPACHDVHSGRTRTYAEFHARIARLAGHLRHRLGLAPGARVLVLSRNDIDVLEIQFACQRAALVFVPLNWRLAAPELVEIARDCGAELLCHGAEFADAALQIAQALPLRAMLDLCCGEASAYEEAVAEGPALAPGGPQPTLADTWSLLYTSGTTGRPKGAQLSYGMALCNAVTLGQAFEITSAAHNLVLLPLFHTGGLNVFANPVFFHGGLNAVLRDFDAGAAIDLLLHSAAAVTHMLAVPTMHAMLLEQPGFGRCTDAQRPRHVATAGAACPAPLLQAYAEHGWDLRQCWGMTEVGPLVLLSPPAMARAKWGSCGLPSMFVDTAILDMDGGPAADGEVGELVVKGPPVTRGYWRRADANAAAFTADGWFRTGDAVRRDADGYFHVVDRWKDMYISGGENVYPAEVERVLACHPGVAESAVVGVPDARWGEAGRAYVVPRHGHDVSAAALRAFCTQQLARYKLPREFVFVQELPHSASGKVLKNTLRAMAPQGTLP